MKNSLIGNYYDNNGNRKYDSKSLLVSSLDSEPGYYHEIIYPLLISEDEKELVHWLKNTGLLRTEQICSRNMIGNTCNNCMSWEEVKGQDMFMWKCEKCSAKKCIREGSVFSGLDCSFKEAIRIVLAWCKGYHADYVANMLGINNSVTEELYVRASSVAEKYIKSNLTEWQVGGPGVIVIIDIYPENCTNLNRGRMGRSILCISEVKSIPQKYWLEALDCHTRNDTEHIRASKQHILEVVQNFVRPGSILVTPVQTQLCSHGDLQSLRHLYPTIVNVADLARHNDGSQNVFINLEVIWKRVLDICEEAQFYCSSYIDLFVVSHMWRTMYGSEAFQMLLYQISSTQ